MKFLFDMLPLFAFIAALVAYDIKIATAVLMVACVIQVVCYRVMFKRFERMHLITLAVVIIFGGLTLMLDDARFIKWKPTVVNWIFTLILLATQVIGKKPGIQYLLGAQLKLPDLQWRKLNMAWAIFFLVLGLLNLYFAFAFRTEGDVSASLFGVVTDEAARDKIWGYFKVFGSIGLTVVFAVASMMLVARHIEVIDPNSAEDKTPDSGD